MKRLAIVLVTLAITWLLLELWFSSRAPRSGVARTGEQVFSAYDPTPDQLEKWRNKRDALRRGPSKRHINVFSERYGWWNRPGGKEVYRDIEIHINGVGARGARELTPAPPEGALRISCYGESFTFGTEVEDDQSWPARLETQSQGNSEGRYEVWNMAVGGWGTDQALLRYRDTRVELDADVVLMGMLSENIGRNVNRLRSAYWASSFQPMVKPRFVFASGGELELLPQPYATELELYEAGVNGSLGLDMARNEWWAPQPDAGWSNVFSTLQRERDKVAGYQWWRLWLDPESEPFRVTLALLERFHAEAVADGARFAGVVLYPAKSDVASPKGRPLTLLYQALDQRGIPYIALHETIRARAARGESTYGRSHFTPEANDEAARVIGTWLAEQLQR